MRFLFVILALATLPVTAQTYRAYVVDITSHQPVGNVVILNMNTQMASITEANGGFVINGRPGNQLRFVHPSYVNHYSYITTRINDTIYMVQGGVTLPEVTVTTDIARFRRDSAERRIIYKKVLEQANSKTTIGSVQGGPNNFGIAANGIFSELALRASGKKKAYKKFERQMLQDEQDRYIAIRYNPTIVTRMTGLSEADAQAFIARHPMPIDFARQASELEIKMWIRERWKMEKGDGK